MMFTPMADRFGVAGPAGSRLRRRGVDLEARRKGRALVKTSHGEIDWTPSSEGTPDRSGLSSAPLRYDRCARMKVARTAGSGVAPPSRVRQLRSGLRAFSATPCRLGVRPIRT